MPDEIEKTEQPSPDDVLAAIQSFNDPNIIINLFGQLGWSYSVEIKETIALAQQNTNMSIKFKAVRYLRELLREAAETSGYVANVSQTYPNAQGGSTTFHAKRLANMLNPSKQIESTIKETQNDKEEIRTEPNRESDRGQSQAETSGADSNAQFPPDPSPIGRADPTEDVDSGGTEPPNGGETSRPVPGAGNGDSHSSKSPDNPCIQTRPPTCDHDLFPGISSAGD